MEVKQTWILSLGLLVTLSSGIPTDDHASGEITLQRSDSQSEIIRIGNSDKTRQRNYAAGPHIVKAGSDANQGNEGEQRASDGFLGMNDDPDIPDYGRLVALVRKQAADHDEQRRENSNLREMVHDLQAEMNRQQTARPKRATAPADSGQGEDKMDPSNLAESECGSNWSSQGSVSSTYVRWGRNDCPSTANKVYAGFAAGSFKFSTGGGSNYLCLPTEPVYLGSTEQLDERRAQLFGVDYEITDFPPFSHLSEQDAPCVVCESVGRSNVLMMPARIDCPNGWMREYYGYLMAQQEIHERSEFVCVDYDAEALPGTAKEGDGADFFPVEGRCLEGSGTPLCDPYVAGRELTCAVCTK